MTVEAIPGYEAEARTQLRFVWLEITGKCQLTCEPLRAKLRITDVS